MRANISYQVLAVLMLGAISQIGQVLFLRELLMVFHGNELSIGLILAAWLFWTGAGSRLGAGLAERIQLTWRWLSWNSAALLLVLPASIMLIRHLRGFFDVLPGAYLSLMDMVLACFMLLAPGCLLLGIQFIALSKAWRERDSRQDTSGAVKTYTGEAAGNMLGGILFSLLLVHYLNAFQCAVLVGGLMLGAVLIMNYKLLAGTRIMARPEMLVSGLLLVIAVLAWPYLQDLNHWAHQQKWSLFSPEYSLVDTRQSKHGDIAVLKRQEQYSFFQSAQLLFSTAGQNSAGSGLEEQQAAIFAHMALAQHKKPEDVLLVGGGMRGTLAEMLKHPVSRLDYLELDEILVQTAQDYVPRSTLQALQDPRVRIRHEDGRLFVRQAQEKYDMLILDVPDPVTAALNRYYTQEFFQEARNILKEDGVLIASADSTADMRDTALANRNSTIYHTLDRVFCNVLAGGEDTIFYLASQDKEQISVDPAVLQERFQRREIQSDAFAAGHFQVLLQDTQVRRTNWIVRHHGREALSHLEGPGRVPMTPGTIQEQLQEELPEVNARYFINQDLKPIGYYHSLMFWDRLTRAERTESLVWLLRTEFWWFLALSGILFCLALGLRPLSFWRGKTWSADLALKFTIFSTGLSTMVLQVALLFSFQSIYGFIYEMVGLIVALFMCGLGLGAAAAHKCFEHKDNINTLAAVQGAMTILAGSIALVLPVIAAIQNQALLFTLFCSLTLLAGLLNGLDFPLAAACCQRLRKKAEKSAGLVYGLELFGACLGAVLCSALLAPVHGIVASCLLACLANGTAFVLILLGRREYAKC